MTAAPVKRCSRPPIANFAELGYDRTTMRSVANEAGVDQKLVAYFFGSKQRLFVAATTLPVRPADVLPRLLAGDLEGIGERMAGFIVGVLEDADTGGRVVGLVRAAATEPQAADMVRDLLSREIFAPAARALPVDEPELRVSLLASQIVGLVMVRYVICAEPLASLPARELISQLGPTFQRYLVGPLTNRPRPELGRS